jgi:hypothetical protein
MRELDDVVPVGDRVDELVDFAGAQAFHFEGSGRRGKVSGIRESRQWPAVVSFRGFRGFAEYRMLPAEEPEPL